MSKFTYEEFGYSAGDFDQLVFHAKKYTKQECVDIFNKEYEYQKKQAKLVNVKEGFVKWFINPTQQMSSDFTGGCYGFVDKLGNGAFPVFVITLSDLEATNYIKWAADIVEEAEEREPICIPDGCVSGEAFDKWLRNKPTADDVEENIILLLNSFPGSYINTSEEIIIHKYSNTYFILKNCETTLDVKCKVLEWLSRPAHKGQPYSKEWKNKSFQNFVKQGINDFLGTDFLDEELEEIYCSLGNVINHQKTIKFVESGYNFDILK